VIKIHFRLTFVTKVAQVSNFFIFCVFLDGCDGHIRMEVDVKLNAKWLCHVNFDNLGATPLTNPSLLLHGNSLSFKQKLDLVGGKKLKCRFLTILGQP